MPNREPQKVFYIHIPFCPSGCRFCHFYLEGRKKKGYIDLLKKEYFIKFGKLKQKVQSIHIGGGTPNILSLEEMSSLLDFINSKLYGFEEFSIELHPALLSFKYLDLLKNKGINRVSFGIQTLDEGIMKKHTRVDLNYQKLGEYVEYSKKIGFQKINFDFIYDLIGDSIENIKANLAFIIKYKPTSIYYYKLRIFTDFLKLNYKSNEKNAFYFYLTIKQFFQANNFTRLNNSVYFDDFALKGTPPFLYDELIYSKNHILIGLGVTTTSNTGKRYFKNTIDYEKYKKNILNNMSAIDLDFELTEETYVLNKFYFFILQKHTFLLEDFLKEFSILMTFDFNSFLEGIVALNFIEFDGSVIKLTEKGHYYIDEKLGEVIFKGKEQEYSLLKKL